MKPSLIPVGRIEATIFLIRGERVILDRDLAQLYGVETRVLNQAVRRNLNRFLPDFIFSLTREEILGISQNVTSSKIRFSKHVYAFTEQGVAMLSSVLRGKRAVEVNVEIMRAFVRLRKFVSTHRELAAQLTKLETHILKHDDQIQAIFEAIRQLMTSTVSKTKEIGFLPKASKK